MMFFSGAHYDLCRQLRDDDESMIFDFNCKFYFEESVVCYTEVFRFFVLQFRSPTASQRQKLDQ
jgi:hypothetical protein